MTFALSRRTLLASTAAVALPSWLRVPAAFAQTKGGTLVVAADTEPRSLNPAIVASNGVFYVASKVVEPLAEMDYQTGLRPLLARSWDASDDGLSFTIHLREGVTWHDGEPFTAADVAFSAMEVWKPLQNLGRVVFKDLETVDTPDDHTAILRFAVPTPGQLIENALPALTSVLPKHVYADGDIAENPANLEPIGTGPFKFAEHKPGEFYRLVRNEDYWEEGKPYLDEIVYRVLPDASAKSAAIETGEIDLTAFSAVPLTDLARLEATDGVTVIPGGYEGITYDLTVEINHRNPILANVDVRKAIAHAIDRNFIVDVIFLGYARAATGLVPASAEAFYTDDVTLYDFDPAAAEALLDEAGYPRGSDGTRFSVSLRPAPWFNESRAAGDYVKQALQRVGIAVELVSADPGGHIKAVYTDHDFDLAIGTPVWRNDPAISTTVLYQGGLPPGVPFANQYGYDSAEMNELIAAGASEVDPAARVAIYADMQRLAADELPLLPLVEFTFTTVARERVQNVANNPRWATSGWADVWLDA
ncbi:ABC transporter substrate-binding protein [Acuticoccus mangrovi]|uniref:ABC transporter substrate-binding protein n=1 Tax=Acuticoccus mangrovi TaxID=2796142 RepID=A0A934MBP6_9HYPH|nr:ABC transporter substrate-binding protein [Acuticoccus mangrovi]MBJ3774357.1 ABC transporter substrate-binding protein [Acuticoccus mangrovi]